MKKETLYQQYLKEKREEDKELLVYAIKNLKEAQRALGKLMLEYLSEENRKGKYKSEDVDRLLSGYPREAIWQLYKSLFSGKKIEKRYLGTRSLKDSIPADAEETVRYLYQNHKRFRLPKLTADVLYYEFYQGEQTDWIASKLGLYESAVNELSYRARTIILNNPEAMRFLIMGVEAYEKERKERDEQVKHLGEQAEKREIPDTVVSIPVDRLNLPARIEHKLRSNGVLTLGEITNMAYVDFRTLKNFGPKSIEKLTEIVQRYIPGWEPKTNSVRNIAEDL